MNGYHRFGWAGIAVFCMQAAGEEVKTVGSNFQEFAAGVYAIKGASDLVSSFRNKLQDLSATFIEYTDVQADVMKTTGLTKQEVESLGKALEKIDTRTSQNELMELAATAGKLGISAREDVEAFVRAADVINVALGEDLGEGALREIGKMADVFGLTKDLGIEQAYLKIGLAINSLGASNTAAEGYLVDFTQRMAGVGSQAGLTIDQVLAYGSAFDQSGQKTEMAATAFQGFIVKMLEDSRKFARIAGADFEEFDDLLSKDVNGAIKLVLQSLHKTGEEGFAKLIPIFDEMHLDGNRAVQALSALAKNVSALEKAEVDSAKAFDEGNSAIEEFNTKNNNAAAQVEKLKNDLETVRQEIGQNLVPILLKTSSAFNTVIKGLAVLVKALPSTTAGVVQLTLALTGLAIGRFTKLPKLTLNFTSSLQTLRLGLHKATVAVGNFFRSFASNPIGLVITALTGLAAAYRKLTESSREAKKSYNEFYAGMSTELKKVDALRTALDETRKGTEEYAAAKKIIIDQYGEYLQGLIDEGGELTNIEETYKRITAAVKDCWATEAKEKQIKKIQDREGEFQAKKAYDFSGLPQTLFPPDGVPEFLPFFY